MKTLWIIITTLFILSGCSQKETQEYIVEKQDMLSPQVIETTLSWSLSELEKTSLLQMREEEKLAHDVYTSLYKTWGKQIFSNISQSEQTHTNAVKLLLDRYQIEDPAKDKEGEFKSEELQKLYNLLVEKWKKSLLDALIVGATIEDLDIYDLQTQSKNIDNEDILLVYQNLERGSRNHMRAFTRNITNEGGIYTPQYISKESFHAIISSPQEKGSGWRGKNNK